MPAKTNTQRAADVKTAAAEMRKALTTALASMADADATEAERHALWAEVERHGATIHRQSRLLAGKSKGG
jgi:hypothetical protein